MSNETMSEMLSSLSLERFVEAQELMYPMALGEVRNGRKRGHWVWYIFPQLKGWG